MGAADRWRRGVPNDLTFGNVREASVERLRVQPVAAGLFGQRVDCARIGLTVARQREGGETGDESRGDHEGAPPGQHMQVICHS